MFRCRAMRQYLMSIGALFFAACGEPGKVGSALEGDEHGGSQASVDRDAGIDEVPLAPDSDKDNDGVIAREDNCPRHKNADQRDFDDDGVGDACDTDNPVCANGGGRATRARSSLYFLLDWSGSMDGLDNGSSTRWERVEAALDTVAVSTVREFDVGVALFPSPEAAMDELKSNLCAEPLEVLALDNHSQHEERFRRSYSQYDTPLVRTRTPTRNALDTLLSRLQKPFASNAGRDAVVLLTDGVPNSAGAPDSCSTNGDEAGAEAAAKAFADAGIYVYVVGMAKDVGEEHLQAMANAGTPGFVPGGPNTPYYLATEAEELVQAFDAIREDRAECTFELDRTGHGMADFARLRVILDRDGDARTLENDAIVEPTAYSLDGSQLTLSPSACMAYRSAVATNGAASVRIVVPCATNGSDGDGGTCVPTAEQCNGVDDDCNGETDEGCGVIF